MAVDLPVCNYVHISVCLLVCLPVCLYVCLSVYSEVVSVCGPVAAKLSGSCIVLLGCLGKMMNVAGRYSGNCISPSGCKVMSI